MMPVADDDEANPAVVMGWCFSFLPGGWIAIVRFIP
jgi:hypothetical protein